MTDFRAIIFDVDGTILNTRELLFQSFEHALSAHGHVVSDMQERLAKVVGLPLSDCYTALVPGGDVLSLCKAHREFQKRKFDLIAPYDGLTDVLGSLKKREMKLGVYSVRSETLRPSLVHANIHSYFDAVIDGSDVVNHKPHPEGVLKVLEQLEVDPSKAVMVGDTPFDIHAGKAAGVALTIGITHGFATKERLEESGADKVIHSLRDLLLLL